MDKSEDAFRTISEAAEELVLPQHVLRFWETRFPQIRPLKRGGGRRYYRPDDVELLRAIRHLLYSEGYTIKGVQRMLKERGVRAVLAMRHEPGGEDAGKPRQHGPASHEQQLGEGGQQAAHAWSAEEESEADPDAPQHAAGQGSVDAAGWRRPAAVSQGRDQIRTDAAPPPGRAPHAISREHRRKLEAIVAELAECRRILGAAII